MEAGTSQGSAVLSPPWLEGGRTLHAHPTTILLPKRSERMSTSFIPFNTGKIIVSDPTAGVMSSRAESRDTAFTVSNIAS